MAGKGKRTGLIAAIAAVAIAAVAAACGGGSGAAPAGSVEPPAATTSPEQPATTAAPAEPATTAASEEPATIAAPAEPATTAASEEPTTTAGTDDPVAAGEELFQRTAAGVGCARCHGTDARGGIGPNVVGKSKEAIQQALGTVAVMQAFTSLTEDQIEAIAAYLETLPSGG